MARIRVRELAEPRGLDISKLSRRADLAYKTVADLWSGARTDVRLSTLERIAAVLEVEVAELIGERKTT